MRRRQQLHPDPQRLVARSPDRASERALVVERGQPVHALDRPGRLPLVEPLLELLGVRRAVEREHLDVELAQPRGQRGTDAAAVGHSTTRLPAPSVTPVATQRSSGGRTTGTGTRRG